MRPHHGYGCGNHYTRAWAHYDERRRWAGQNLSTTKDGVGLVKTYLETIKQEARARYDAGMSYQEAALDMALGVFDDWGDRERLMVNCATLYREFGSAHEPEIAELFAAMAHYRQVKG